MFGCLSGYALTGCWIRNGGARTQTRHFSMGCGHLKQWLKPHASGDQLVFLIASLIGVKWYLIVALIFIPVTFVMLSVFSYTSWSFVCFLLWNVYLDFLCILFHFWVVCISYIFWILSAYQMYVLKIYFSSSETIFCFVDGFLGCI